MSYDYPTTPVFSVTQLNLYQCFFRFLQFEHNLPGMLCILSFTWPCKKPECAQIRRGKCWTTCFKSSGLDICKDSGEWVTSVKLGVKPGVTPVVLKDPDAIVISGSALSQTREGASGSFLPLRSRPEAGTSTAGPSSQLQERTWSSYCLHFAASSRIELG